MLAHGNHLRCRWHGATADDRGPPPFPRSRRARTSRSSACRTSSRTLPPRRAAPHRCHRRQLAQNTDWLYNSPPAQQPGNVYSALRSMPAVTLEASGRGRREAGESVIDLQLSNPADVCAFAVRIQVLDPNTGQRVLPVFASDNYLTLLPGASRSVGSRFRRCGAAGPASSSAAGTPRPRACRSRSRFAGGDGDRRDPRRCKACSPPCPSHPRRYGTHSLRVRIPLGQARRGAAGGTDWRGPQAIGFTPVRRGSSCGGRRHQEGESGETIAQDRGGRDSPADAGLRRLTRRYTSSTSPGQPHATRAPPPRFSLPAPFGLTRHPPSRVAQATAASRPTTHLSQEYGQSPRGSDTLLAKDRHILHPPAGLVGGRDRLVTLPPASGRRQG